MQQQVERVWVTDLCVKACASMHRQQFEDLKFKDNLKYFCITETCLHEVLLQENFMKGLLHK